MHYTVGEMAKKLGVAPSTLRYYDKEGLLPFVARSEGGIRIFQDSDLEWLHIISCLKATGMQIKDIRAFIYLCMQGDETIDARLSLFQKRKDEAERQMAELQDALDTITFKCWYYETAKAAGTTDAPEQMPDEALPPEIRKIRKKLKNG